MNIQWNEKNKLLEDTSQNQNILEKKNFNGSSHNSKIFWTLMRHDATWCLLGLSIFQVQSVLWQKSLFFFPQKNLHQTFHSKLFLSSLKFQSPENLPCERDALTKQFSSPPASANKFSYVHVSQIFFAFQLDIQRSVFPTTSQANPFR